MKRLPALIAAAFFMAYASVCFGSYVIYLKDGRNFSTERYWEEGDQIKFKRFGGVIGIEKDLVKEIEEKIDLPEKGENQERIDVPDKARTEEVQPLPPRELDGSLKPERDDLPAPAAPAAGDTPLPMKEAEDEGPGKEAKDEASFRARKAALTLEVKEALEEYRRARRERNPQKATEEFRKVSRISGEMEDLEKEVKERNGGRLPDWWWKRPNQDRRREPEGPHAKPEGPRREQ